MRIDNDSQQIRVVENVFVYSKIYMHVSIFNLQTVTSLGKTVAVNIAVTIDSYNSYHFICLKLGNIVFSSFSTCSSCSDSDKQNLIQQRL